MNQYTTIIARWLFWALIVSLESVVGFPWISVFLAGEWIFAEKDWVLVSLVFVATVLAGAYGVSLTVSLLLFVIVWQAWARTRKNAWTRIVVAVGASVVLGYSAGVPLNALTVVGALIELVALVWLTQKGIAQKPWKKIKLFSLPEH